MRYEMVQGDRFLVWSSILLPDLRLLESLVDECLLVSIPADVVRGLGGSGKS